MIWLWLGATIVGIYAVYRIGEWLNNEDSPRKEELHSLVVAYKSKDITLSDFDEILRRVNNKIATSCKNSARLIHKPVRIKDVVNISTITSEDTVQFVIWYKDKPVKREKRKPYNPHVFGNSYQNRNYKL